MASSSTSPFSRARVVSALTTTQHVSALVFGSFLFVHLAAPSVAAVAPHGGALDLSTKTMILGRVYYQNTLTEPVVVYGAVGVHLAASFVKRFIVEYTIWSRKQRGARKAKEVEGYVIPDADVEEMYAHHPAPASRWAYIVQNLPSAHAFSGALLLPAVAIHAWLNRIAPSSADAPIHELSPSELDYSYVTYGLSSGSGAPVAWRRITWALYGVLLAAGAVHVVGGADRIAKRMRVRKAADAARRRQRTAAAAAAAADGNGSASTATKSATDSASTSDMEPGASRAAMRATDLRRKRQRKTAVTAAISAAGVAWLSWGLARMASEKSGVSGFLAKRVHACYARVWPYSLWR